MDSLKTKSSTEKIIKIHTSANRLQMYPLACMLHTYIHTYIQTSKIVSLCSNWQLTSMQPRGCARKARQAKQKKKQKQRNKKTSANSTWHSVQNIKLHGSSRERCSGLPILESLGYLGAESIRMRAHTYAVQRNHLRKVKKISAISENI